MTEDFPEYIIKEKKNLVNYPKTQSYDQNMY